ncbi:adenine phosphoribosyltransferase [Spiroplasma endosymbiont of Anurida maritima]|uniref:adenine phosphoribosyltransferase n=1 Tax=Spiroplasma endosymbiont of Anurida maritima TaxID=2967972 RepID=UPI0036D2D3C7
MNLKDYIIEVQDFPKKGISFKDITPILNDKKALAHTIRAFSDFAKKIDANVIIGPESRGFLFGVPTSYDANIRFVPARKPGKLPRKVLSESYDLEYGKNILEIHKGDIKKGDRVLIVDDILATGGTIDATIELVKRSHAKVVGVGIVVELTFLNGFKHVDEEIEKLSLVKY